MKLSNKLIYVLLFLSAVWAIFLFSQKGGLHIDEQWSYGFSNSSIGGYFYQYEIGQEPKFISNWISNEEIKKYFMVQDGERFSYSNTYKNLERDVHPPMYFFLLHTVSSFFVNSMSVWQHAIINILFFVLSLFLLHKIAKLFIEDEILALVPVVWYGFSQGGIDSVLFARVYVLKIFFGLMLFYYSMLFYRAKKINGKYLFFIYCSILCGVLSHFFIIPFTLCLMGGFGGKYLFQKKFVKLGWYLLVCCLGLLSLFVVFKPSYNILTNSVWTGWSIRILSWFGDNVGYSSGLSEVFKYLSSSFDRFFSYLLGMSFGVKSLSVISLVMILLVGVVLCCCGGFWGILAFLIMGEYLAVFVPVMHIFEYRYFMILLPFWCLFFVVSFYKMYDWLSFSKCNLLVKRFLSLGIVFCILSYMSFGANSLFLFRKSDNDIKFNEEVKGKNVVVMLPYSWMFHEILWYLKDAKNVYTMLSTDVNEVKEEELFGKDTLVLIMNHDSRDDLKLRSRNVSPYIKNEDGLEFLYIVQFSERFYDVYKVK